VKTLIFPPTFRSGGGTTTKVDSEYARGGLGGLSCTGARFETTQVLAGEGLGRKTQK
jgi:hypothetical protein